MSMVKSDVTVKPTEDRTHLVVTITLPYTSDPTLRERVYMRAHEFVRMWYERRIIAQPDLLD